MKKNLIVLLASTAVLAAAITVAACATKKVTTPKAAAPVAIQATTTAQTTEEIINDGQNPVMNFIGNYYGGRACITVEAEGTDGANISVVWGASYNTKAIWTMSATFNEDETSLVYENGYKKMITLNEDGEIISEDILSVDLKGVFVFENDGVTWDDFNEHIADGMVFRYGNSVEDVCTTIFPEETVEAIPEETVESVEPTATPAPTTVPTTAPTATPTPVVVPEPETKSTEAEETKPTAEITEPARKTAAEISGTYVSGRATATVDASDPNNVMIKVVWGESADTKAIWRIYGRYNEETETILYEGGVKKVLTYNENGDVELEEVDYTDGCGAILFSYDGFTWDDYNENVAYNIVFIKSV